MNNNLDFPPSLLYRAGYSGPNGAMVQILSDPQVIEFIRAEIQTILTDAIGQPVEMPLDEHLINTIASTIQANWGIANVQLPGDMTTIASALIQDIIVKECKNRYYALKQKALLYKYFIDLDLKVWPERGIYDHNLHEESFSNSDLRLLNPVKRFQAQYLRDTYQPGRPRAMHPMFLQR